MKKEILTYKLSWQYINIDIRYRPHWYTRYCEMAHLEINSSDGMALPITETGYRSHFIHPEAIEQEGGAVEYVRKWLELEANNNPKWKNKRAEQSQLKLF